MNRYTSSLNAEIVPVFCDRLVFVIFVCLEPFIISSTSWCKV